MKIRPYTASDWKRVCEIHDAARRDELAAAGLSDAYLPLAETAGNEGFDAYAIRVAERDGNVVGFVAFTQEELAWLYVAPPFYATGIGTALIQAALQETAAPLSAEVLEGNAAAMAVYKKAGFVEARHLHGRMPGNESFAVSVTELRHPGVAQPFHRADVQRDATVGRGSCRTVDVMRIAAATPADIDRVVVCLAAAFAEDPITGFLLETGPGYRERLRRFVHLLARARIALRMPVLVARDTANIHGAAMGSTTNPPPWPSELEEVWSGLDRHIPGFNDRAALYDQIAEKAKPAVPHYYLGMIGVDAAMHGVGIGTQLLKSFCELSAADQLSAGVYLETANPSNVRFYERNGFEVTGQGRLGPETLWCMFLCHDPCHDA